MDKTESVEVSHRGRIDKRLSEQLEHSRSTVQKLIQNEQVLLNDQLVTKKSHTVQPGDTVRVTYERFDPRHETVEAEEGPLRVLYEDDFVLAVNKPAGMVVHPNAHTSSNTLVNRILHHYPGQESFARAGLVHRLDKATSGVVLVGRTDETITGLKQQFKERSINKKYFAIVCGVLSDDTIKVDVPIGRDPKNPMLRTARPEGKQAITELRVVGRGEDRTAVHCHPISGRTHQIRVHCQYLDSPILGDEKYNGPDAERLMLHAETIEFNHPVKDQIRTVTSEPPEEVLNPWQDICT